jgi:hypothetical protein
MQAADQLALIASAFQQLQRDEIKIAAFSHLARQQVTLLDALGVRYTDVLHQLLDRLESSALFTEESCSFSQSGMLENLQLWLDKAALQLAKA